MDKNLLKNCEYFVRDIFSKSNPKLYYHNIQHTEEVVSNSKTICNHLKISPDDTEIIIIAAWFHDCNYVFSPKNHEEKSADIAEKYLLSQSYQLNKIKKVRECILATKIPQSPKNILAEILCDADLFHIGSDKFFERNEMYKNEITRQFKIKITEKSFIENTIVFFSSHKFFTSYSKQFLEKIKVQNISILKKQLEDIR